MKYKAVARVFESEAYEFIVEADSEKEAKQKIEDRETISERHIKNSLDGHGYEIVSEISKV